MTTSMPADPSAVARTQELLKQLWVRHKPTIVERLEAFEHACAMASALDPKAREEARSIAHKLAGSLGTFGLQEGTEKAREAEAIFNGEAISQVDQQTLSELARRIRQIVEAHT